MGLILTLIGVIASCTKTDDEIINDPSGNDPTTQGNSSVDDIDVPTDFNYDVTQSFNIKITSSAFTGKALYSIYMIDDQGNYTKLGNSISNDQGLSNYRVTLPSYVERLYIVKRLMGKEWYKLASVTSNELEVDFDKLAQEMTSSGRRALASCEDYVYAMNHQGAFFSIAIEKDGYDQTDYGTINTGGYAMAYDQDNNIFYYDVKGTLFSYNKETQTTTQIKKLTTGIGGLDNGYPRMAFNKWDGLLYIGNSNNYAMIDPSDGSVVKTLTGTGIANNQNGGGDLTFASDGTIYQACSGGLFRLAVNEDSTNLDATRISADNFPHYLTGVTIDRFDYIYASTNHSDSKLIYMDVKDGSYIEVATMGRKMNDLTSFRCRESDFEGEDSDNDGVVDGFDNYPDDPNKAFDNYTPGENGFGTFAFEDLYPQKGDYDFNDIMVQYRHNFVANGQNKVVKVYSTFVVKSVRSDLPCGFAYQLPIHADSIASVTGAKILTGVVSLDTKGLETGIDPSAPVMIVFDNHFGLVKGNGNIKKSDEFVIETTFVTPVEMSSFPVEDFNPFIFINQVRSNELHLANGTPTEKYDQSLRTAGEDSGNYKTTEGHPWGLHIAHKFHPPKESIDITNAYVNFRNFVESAGVNKKNWYTDDSGNRNTSLMYVE
ncbi:LruC domain-containing protein [Flammeovirga aprica]|uniref:LruC domain-containing protein n=1 Tax=Flammeovirga aprica JL-4 TaxID=694437 RepID=A0A7X9S0V9_9BACT|nr:LruC domain-containing protein [Flammeovirga aprica]NME72261.1 LruC domain-containing protein [Flammeovirga aprica JL-4]